MSIDTEALRARLAPLAWHSTPPITTDHVRRVLDALDAAEHRATRAEAQSEARRLDIEYWKETALQERGAALDTLEQIKARDQRIQAVRDVLEESEARGPVGMTFNGTPFPAWVSIATVRRALTA